MLQPDDSLVDFEDDPDDSRVVLDPRVSKEDLKLHISGTVLSMINVNFENAQIEGLKQSVCRADENVIDEALDILVEEIFESFAISNKDEGLNFEEWCEWFTSLEGVNEMLMNSS